MSDLTELRAALDDLVAEHTRAGSPLARHLRPGLAAEVVAARLAAAGLEPASDAIGLYGWADGIDQASWHREAPGARGLELFPYAFFSDLGTALEDYARMRAMTEETLAAGAGAPGDDLWRPSWLPIFEEAPGWYGLDCASATGPSPVWIMYWDSTDIDPTRQVFAGLTLMIRALIARFRAGAYSWSEEHRRLLADEAILASTFGQRLSAVEDLA